ncbi:MAG: hypothetical protein ABGZ35_25775 [Planctomycetaceae bacterium]|jgi:hypothetical protein
MNECRFNHIPDIFGHHADEDGNADTLTPLDNDADFGIARLNLAAK